MKALSPALQAHLDDGTTTLAWCWRIERSDGAVFGFTDHDRPLGFDGTSYEPESGLIASEVRTGSDLSVDAQDAEGVLSSDRITETDILDGRWDNAEVLVWRVNWEDPAQRVMIRRGAVGQIRRGRLAFVAEMRSLAHVLGQTVGRSFQATCDAELGDARCGVEPRGGLLPRHRRRGRPPARPRLHRLGPRLLRPRLVRPRHRRVDQRRQCRPPGRDHAARERRRRGRLHAARGAGARDRGGRRLRRPGRLSERRSETCRDKFGNVANFRGFPHIPGNDAVVRYASKDGGHDGEPLYDQPAPPPRAYQHGDHRWPRSIDLTSLTEHLAEKVHNLEADTLKVMLTNAAPVAGTR